MIKAIINNSNGPTMVELTEDKALLQDMAERLHRRNSSMLHSNTINTLRKGMSTMVMTMATDKVMMRDMRT
jgi:hypothetical protein